MLIGTSACYARTFLLQKRKGRLGFPRGLSPEDDETKYFLDVNGFLKYKCTGEMVADMPMDIPRFGLIALIVAIPLFFLFNSLFTLRPEMVLIVAMLLAIGAQALVNRRRRTIADKAEAESARTRARTVTRERIFFIVMSPFISILLIFYFNTMILQVSEGRRP